MTAVLILHNVEIIFVLSNLYSHKLAKDNLPIGKATSVTFILGYDCQNKGDSSESKTFFISDSYRMT